MRIHNLLSLPHLSTKQTKGKELFVNDFQSHVTFEEYLVILKKKAMDKVAIDEAK
jgi:hypothetical protein